MGTSDKSKNNIEHLWDIINNFGLMVLEMDENGKIINANQNIERILGYPQEKILGEKWWKIAYADPAQRKKEKDGLIARCKKEEDQSPPTALRNYDLEIIRNPSLSDNEGKNLIWTIWTEIKNRTGGLIWIGREITQDKQVEKALSEALDEMSDSEKRFRTVADFTSDWEYWLDPEGCLQYISPACERITGYPPHDFEKHPELMRQIVYPDDRAKVSKHFREERESTESLGIEYRIYTRKGELRWIGHECQMVHDVLGNSLGRRASNRDISDLKQTEKMLLVQRDLAVSLSITRNLVDALNEVLKAAFLIPPIDSGGVFLIDQYSGTLNLMTSKGWLREFVNGVTHITGDSSLGHLFITTRPLYLSYSDIQNNKPVEDIAHREGFRSCTILPVTFRGRVVATLLFTTHTHNDITQNSRNILEAIAAQIGGVIARLEAEEALQENQRNLQSLFNTLEDFAFILNMEGRIMNFNQVVRELLLYTSHELLSMNITNLYPFYRRDDANKLIESMKNRKSTPCSIPLMAKDGALILVESTYTKGKWGDQEVLFLIASDISDRKQFEELKESEARFKAIVQDQTEMICRFLPNYNLTFVNDAYCRYFQKTSDELIGRNLLSFMPENDHDRLEKNLANINQANPMVSSELHIIHPDGTEGWHQWTDRAIYNDTGTLVEYQSVGKDITEQKITTELLYHSENQFRMIAEESPDAIFILNSERDKTGQIIDFNIIYCNSKGREQISKENEVLIGKRFTEIFPPFFSLLLKKYIQVVETEHTLDEEYSIASAQGTLWYHHHVVALRDGIVSIHRNITQDKWIEQSLDEHEKHNQILTETLHEGLGIINQNDVFSYVNDPLCKMLDYSPLELVDRKIIDLILKEEHKSFQKYLAELRNGENANFEMIMIGKDSRRIVASISSRALFNANEEYTGSLFTILDITESRNNAKIISQLKQDCQNYIKKDKELNETTSMINEMGELLQACITSNDTLTVVSEYIQRLFPQYCGAIYLSGDTSGLMTNVLNWGNWEPEVKTFETEQCWGLRRGQTHVVINSLNQFRCEHLYIDQPTTGESANPGEDSSDKNFPYICVPLKAQRENIGLFHIQLRHATYSGKQTITKSEVDEVKQLAMTIADRIAQTILNMKLKEKLNKFATHDPITGLFNREYMQKVIERELERAVRHKRSVGLVITDIDNFNQFNILNGPGAGDYLLKEIGNFLANNIRSGDIVGRFGDDKFIILMYETSLEDAVKRADQLRIMVKELQPVYQERSIPAPAISLGVACYPLHGTSTEFIVKTAKEALKKAKEEGRDRVKYIEPQ